MISSRKHILRDLQLYLCTSLRFPRDLHHILNEGPKHKTQPARWFSDALSYPIFAKGTDCPAHVGQVHEIILSKSKKASLSDLFQFTVRNLPGNCGHCKVPCQWFTRGLPPHLKLVALPSVPRDNELNSHSSGQNANNLACVNHLQDDPRASQSTDSASKSDLSEPTLTQEQRLGGPGIDHPIDRATVPDTEDLPPWGIGTLVISSGAKDGPRQVLGTSGAKHAEQGGQSGMQWM